MTPPTKRESTKREPTKSEPAKSEPTKKRRSWARYSAQRFVSLTPESAQRLEAIAEERGVSVSSLLREAADEYLAKHG